MMTSRIIKKIFSILMAVLLVLVYIPTNSYAATDFYRWDGTNNTRGEDVTLGSNTNALTQMFDVRLFENNSLVGDNIKAFCIDLVTNIKSNVNYTVDFLENVNYFPNGNAPRVRAVIYGSYPQVDLQTLKNSVGLNTNLTDKEAIAGTQMAIWHLANGATPDLTKYNGASKQRILALYNYLVALPGISAPQQTNIIASGPFLSFDGDDAVVTFSYSTNGVNNLDNSPVVLSYSTNLVGFSESSSVNAGVTTVELRKDKSLLAAPFAFSIEITGQQTLADAFVFTPVGGRDQSQTLVSKGFVTDIPLKEILEGNLQNLLGQIIVNKAFADQSSDEVEFSLYFGESLVESKFTVNQSVSFINLLPGNYILTENTPSGYVSSIEDGHIFILNSGDSLVIDVYNDLEPTTEEPTTEAPTTEAPTTEEPTTEAPTTEAPTTEEPTTEAPTTEAPTTEAPTTEAPTTEEPTTEAPTTEAPTTEAPTTEAPTTEEPITEEPTTEAPTTEAPTTEAPTTVPPTELPTEVPTEAPTEVIEEEDTPLGPASTFTDIDAFLIPEITETEAFEVEDEAVPLADALPETGQLPVEGFIGLGSLITTAGLFLKKKK